MWNNSPLMIITWLSYLSFSVDSYPLNQQKRSTTFRWENPCLLQVQTDTQSLQPAVIPLKVALQQIYQKANLQRDAAITLRKHYIPTLGERITNPFLIKYLESAEMDELDLIEESTHCENNITVTLLEDYRRLSFLAVFLEKVVEDEVFYEHGELYDNMKPVQDYLYQLMCDMHTTIYTVVNGAITNHVTREVMSDELRNLSDDRASRYYRDYTIVSKDIEFLSQFSDKYLNITKSIS
ncbi:uncharacterized protein LOC134249916 [Saccostrea cucullata]|uniref:uncharacterized protein LOC134249916 n=1 Tax=Saccostrea cuccullata TaxID=36930 RepID=UPI002ED1066B